MMIELHRFDDGLPEDTDRRIVVERDDIRQVHVGRGGVTIVTTTVGKLPVEEGYDEVKAMMR